MGSHADSELLTLVRRNKWSIYWIAFVATVGVIIEIVEAVKGG